MAINLWVKGGKLTAYNPLPLGNVAVKVSLFNEYIMTFKAKSATGATLRVSSFNVVNDIHQSITLTSDFKSYSFSWKETEGGNVYLTDVNSIGDIIIDSIELVQKPLPKFTINGIDGFSSGKWTLHANAKVIDDETLELNATANPQQSLIQIPVTSGLQYTASVICSKGAMLIAEYNASRIFLRTLNGTSGVFTKTVTISNDASFLGFILQNDGTLGQFTFKRPMLNLGTIPAPYSKKTGEKMVLPVAKKNLFDGLLLANKQYASNGLLIDNANSLCSVNMTTIKPNLSYVISNTLNYASGNLYVNFFDTSKVHISRVNIPNGTFTAPNNAYYVHFFYSGSGSDIANKIQIEEGSVKTAYAPYEVQLNKKPKRTLTRKRSVTSKRNLEARR